MADVGEEANMEKDFFEKDEKEGQTKNGYLIQEKKNLEAVQKTV